MKNEKEINFCAKLEIHVSPEIPKVGLAKKRKMRSYLAGKGKLSLNILSELMFSQLSVLLSSFLLRAN